ncbi:hypothetical protein JM16_004116 [Phytophthora kernoviae]|uniref:THH1/TOM1/TOM3 domain-containing protein n=1 Tax=Phytophthora kernoviae TaxID=325452 RepID=A0A8T0M269_9STRA|nr:hypothetical protein JM16_004116 [Phytophthora kernoviae]
MLGLNVTDATCAFGLAQTSAGCVRTLASYDQSGYLTYQIIYCVIGALTEVASAIMYWRAVKYDGSPLQQYSFLLCCYASLTVLFRGIDPSSYGHILPRPIGAFFTDSSYNMSLFAFKGFQPATLNYVQLSISAGVLAIVSLAFLIFGLRVLSRLQALVLSDDEDGVPVVAPPQYTQRRPKEGHSHKIKQILFTAEGISIIVIAGQLYMALTNVSNSPVELSCANGMLCDSIKTKWSLLHTLQVVCVWIILWIFRGIQKRGVVPRPRGSIIYCAMGVVSAIASGVMYWRAIKHDCSPLQNYCFLFCGYASVTVIVRGADPTSYGHIIPRPISAWLTDSCTAALYSVYILALGYWAHIIRQGAVVDNKSSRLRCLEASAIAFVWTFYTAYNMSLFAFKGFQPLGLNYMQISVSACILGAISTTFLVYGLRVLSHLQSSERDDKPRMSNMLCERMEPNGPFDLEIRNDNDGIPAVPKHRFAHRKPKAGHTAKIKAVLIVAEVVSVIVIAGQLYVAVIRASTTPVELSCANGYLCHTVKASVNLLHVFQVLCVWVLLWTFGRIHKKNDAPPTIV